MPLSRYSAPFLWRLANLQMAEMATEICNMAEMATEISSAATKICMLLRVRATLLWCLSFGNVGSCALQSGD